MLELSTAVPMRMQAAGRQRPAASHAAGGHRECSTHAPRRRPGRPCVVAEQLLLGAAVVRTDYVEEPCLQAPAGSSTQGVAWRHGQGLQVCAEALQPLQVCLPTVAARADGTVCKAQRGKDASASGAHRQAQAAGSLCERRQGSGGRQPFERAAHHTRTGTAALQRRQHSSGIAKRPRPPEGPQRSELQPQGSCGLLVARRQLVERWRPLILAALQRRPRLPGCGAPTRRRPSERLHGLAAPAMGPLGTWLFLGGRLDPLRPRPQSHVGVPMPRRPAGLADH
mmetsp:Transcript_57702/g.185433  ORF Transcript_57702/g.185433 Transcript_57702/m.185433 type:complete len:282 (-) Transcript_57702:166-1011(-)